MEEGESIENSILTRQIEGAQKKVEAMHFDVRKQLLSYDDVMNQQREAVYRERDEILSGTDTIERTFGIMEDTLSSILGNVSGDSGEPDVKGAATRLKSIFWPGIENHLNGVETPSDMSGAEDRIKAELRARFDGKIAELGTENAARVMRYVLLQVLDASWREHLLGMDELRRGIGLRAIGQKDPLLEYQFESYELFQQTLQGVREKVAEYALRVTVVSRERQPSGRTLLNDRDAIPSGLRDSSAVSGAMAGNARVLPVQKGKKVGRNDPCPCGSGKKYKFCCGRTPHAS
ncbi:MAG: SEC-C domain-containing protein [Synergistaceae bacterium]|nr:SEC-C domain-containing protein [Synergistaceae bacterium]